MHLKNNFLGEDGGRENFILKIKNGNVKFVVSDHFFLNNQIFFMADLFNIMVVILW